MGTTGKCSVFLALTMMLTTSVTLCHSSRILMIPLVAKSHQSLMASIAEELLRRNHEVYVYMGELID